LYDIYYTENFNPNSRNHLLFEKGLFKIHVAVQLERLCRRFNNQRSKETFGTIVIEPDELKAIPKHTKLVHQCPDCLTVYDPEFGDMSKNIAAGTLFDELPDTYCCSTCDTAKADMQAVEMNKIIALNTAA
jgi:rubredoxin